jgi:hypothetical protein
LTFWAWLTSLNMKFSSSTNLPANNIISFFFNDWIKLHYVYMPHFVNPVIIHGATGWLPKLGCCNSVQLFLELGSYSLLLRLAWICDPSSYFFFPRGCNYRHEPPCPALKFVFLME